MTVPINGVRSAENEQNELNRKKYVNPSKQQKQLNRIEGLITFNTILLERLYGGQINANS